MKYEPNSLYPNVNFSLGLTSKIFVLRLGISHPPTSHLTKLFLLFSRIVNNKDFKALSSQLVLFRNNHCFAGEWDYLFLFSCQNAYHVYFFINYYYFFLFFFYTKTTAVKAITLFISFNWANLYIIYCYMCARRKQPRGQFLRPNRRI